MLTACGYVKRPSRTQVPLRKSTCGRITPERFGSGVGTMLLGSAEVELRRQGVMKAFLWTLADDDRTVSFYETRGWLRDGARMMLEFDQPRAAVRCTKALVSTSVESTE